MLRRPLLPQHEPLLGTGVVQVPHVHRHVSAGRDEAPFGLDVAEGEGDGVLVHGGDEGAGYGGVEGEGFGVGLDDGELVGLGNGADVVESVGVPLPLVDRNVLRVEPRGVLVRGKDVEG